MAPTKAKKKTTKSRKPSQSEFLTVLLKRRKNPGAMRRLIDLADKDEITACSEVIYNAYKGNVKLSPTLIKQLARNKRAAQRLLDKNASLLEKKRILKKSQVGGFLGAILGTLGNVLLKPIVGSIVGGLSRRR